MGFRTKLEHTMLFIPATAVLHNMARTLNDPRPPDVPGHNHDDGHPGDDEDGDGDEEHQGQPPPSAAADRVEGKLFRDRISPQMFP
jgi:hypothetical protein